MMAQTLFRNDFETMNETELFAKIQLELVNRYQVDPQLASEMAWDLMDMLSAVDGNFDIFEKYFLHQNTSLLFFTLKALEKLSVANASS